MRYLAQREFIEQHLKIIIIVKIKSSVTLQCYATGT